MGAVKGIGSATKAILLVSDDALVDALNLSCADLRVVQPTKFQLAIRTAQVPGLTISAALFVPADDPSG